MFKKWHFPLPFFHLYPIIHHYHAQELGFYLAFHNLNLGALSSQKRTDSKKNGATDPQHLWSGDLSSESRGEDPLGTKQCPGEGIP